MPDLLIDGPDRDWIATLILAHGAGAPMDSEFMNAFALEFAYRKIRIVRFEFPYMVERRRTGNFKPPNRPPILESTWRMVIEKIGAQRTFIGGKSMGGRIATTLADSVNVNGVVCLGYPFHPIGKPDKLRIEHLHSIQTPVLIVQGERDRFGNRTEVEGYQLPPRIKIRWLTDGDHSFKPRKSSAVDLPQNIAQAVNESATFISTTLGKG